ncbi:MAG: hypothetical protein HY819_02820 [Acidobacteria bacterium]|nr:hypothetical protein [Acidobacteriota bacterium]
MSKKFFSTAVGVIIVGLILLGIFYLLSNIFHWNTQAPSPTSTLDIIAGAISLLWLLFIVKVPWDLYFETNNVLFEMKRSEEKNIPVNLERRKYVERIRIITGVIAIGAHIASALIIAGITYFAGGQIGYYFSFFYLLTTFFRPASQAYYYLINKLREIRGEILYPREDVNKLKLELCSAINRVTCLESRLKDSESRLNISEETAKTLRSEIRDINFAVERVDKASQHRIELLTSEVERALTKAFDQQDIINGLRAFAKLIKQA